MNRLLPAMMVAAKNQLSVIFFHAVLLLLLAGCRATNKPDEYVIGFSQCIESDAWRKTMLEEMKRELAFHPNVKFIYM